MTPSSLRLVTRQGQKAYQPGDIVSGGVWWSCNEPPKSVDVALLWFTRGKGTEDVAVVDRTIFENPQPDEGREFSFILPAGPYSSSGRLISIIWALELVLQPGGHSVRTEIVIAPNGKEVLFDRGIGL